LCAFRAFGFVSDFELRTSDLADAAGVAFSVNWSGLINRRGANATEINSLKIFFVPFAYFAV